jgi:ribosomal-protein-alanine N-acetyltransferase
VIFKRKLIIHGIVIMISGNSKMIKPPNKLSTDRLFLRFPVSHDADIIFRKYAQDLEVTKYLIWQPHETIDVTREYIQKCILSWKNGDAFPWIIVRKEDNEVIGMFELRIDGFRADIGYVISREYWGLGYATEIIKAVIEWLLKQDSIFRIWATCDIENLASARALEKAGMLKEGILRRYIIHPNISNEPRDSFCFSVVR